MSLIKDDEWDDDEFYEEQDTRKKKQKYKSRQVETGSGWDENWTDNDY